MHYLMLYYLINAIIVVGVEPETFVVKTGDPRRARLTFQSFLRLFPPPSWPPPPPPFLRAPSIMEWLEEVNRVLEFWDAANVVGEPPLVFDGDGPTVHNLVVLVLSANSSLGGDEEKGSAMLMLAKAAFHLWQFRTTGRTLPAKLTGCTFEDLLATEGVIPVDPGDFELDVTTALPLERCKSLIRKAMEINLELCKRFALLVELVMHGAAQGENKLAGHLASTVVRLVVWRGKRRF